MPSRFTPSLSVQILVVGNGGVERSVYVYSQSCGLIGLPP